MEGKAAVLGDADFVMPFSALGLDTFAVEADSASVAEAADKILKAQYVLVVVAENVAEFERRGFELCRNLGLGAGGSVAQRVERLGGNP